MIHETTSLQQLRQQNSFLRNHKTSQINCQKPQNRKKFRPKPKADIKALTDKASVGFRMSRLFIFLRLKLFYFPKLFLRIPSSLLSAAWLIVI